MFQCISKNLLCRCIYPLLSAYSSQFCPCEIYIINLILWLEKLKVRKIKLEVACLVGGKHKIVIYIFLTSAYFYISSDKETLLQGPYLEMLIYKSSVCFQFLLLIFTHKSAFHLKSLKRSPEFNFWMYL